MTNIILCTNREIANALRENTFANGFTKIVNDDLAWFFDDGVQDILEYLDKILPNVSTCMGEKIVETTHHIKCKEDIPYTKISSFSYSAIQEGDELVGMDMLIEFSDGSQKLIPIC